ncbi:MAG: hypothetical protein H8D45_07815 [Bacteroidetes bacterium]|nr:hypothetical protein [Bacteroidota bacterium]
MKKHNPFAALISMILGGGSTITLIIADFTLPLQLDENVFGISISAIAYFIFHKLLIKKS